jgi:beta-carotene hydroxylase
MATDLPNRRPTINDLGRDLLVLSTFNLIATIVTPFLFFVLYFAFSVYGFWVLAIVCTMALSFASYGSTSHDLVHENLNLNKSFNNILLSVIEAICFRSGHAYKLSHLYHHKRYPHEDDVEGRAARMSLIATLFEGVIFQLKLFAWAVSFHRHHKYFKVVLLEGVIVLMLVAFCIYSLSFTNIYFVYMCLMIAGSWIIPLVTSYAVHTPDGVNDLHQTRLFRGQFFSLIAFNHLFHLEHHLYPTVPHKNWRKLSQRLDSYFASEGIKAMEVKF